MNNKLITRTFFILQLLCAILVGSGEARASSSKGARLIIQRTPNFGTNLIVQLSIDGKRVADIPRNQHYGGTISAGRHVLTVLAMPNAESRRPTSMRVTVRSGELYIFTAMWERDQLVLRRSTTYSPTTAVPAAH
jgi:hypothetical protein